MNSSFYSGEAISGEAISREAILSFDDTAALSHSLSEGSVEQGNFHAFSSALETDWFH
jgi:hypothetical protein